MEAAEPRSPLSRLDLAILLTLAFLGLGGLLGLVAVLDANGDAAAIGRGLGFSALAFETGATLAAALACLVRGRAELLALGGVVAAGLALDLFALGIVFEISSATYAKLAGLAFAWSFFALLALGLTLAVQPLDALARVLYLAAVGASLLGGLIATILVVSTGSDDVAASISPVPVTSFGNEDLLRPLGAVLVVLATLWFGALAASRVERRPVDVTR